ncbi:GAF and ANTAR domain-containing protein [Nakamurella alba]|nr:GAF and ANTAR domain-containing protein [Nakamurella alba]
METIPQYLHDLIGEARSAIGQGDRAEGFEEALRGVTTAAIASGICDLAGITERRGRTLTTIGASAPLVEKLDAAQYEAGEGPCVAAAFDDRGVLVSQDLQVDPRWPTWGPAAVELGVHSVLGIQLYVDDEAMGALNLYSRTPRTFSTQDVETAQFIAANASFSLAHFRNVEQLWTAIDARHRIGLAQGILMGRFDLTVDRSFEVLRRMSQQQHLKLSAVASAVIAARGLPPTDPSTAN